MLGFSIGRIGNQIWFLRGRICKYLVKRTSYAKSAAPQDWKKHFLIIYNIFIVFWAYNSGLADFNCISGLAISDYR
jgi:hypothetical protein